MYLDCQPSLDGASDEGSGAAWIIRHDAGGIAKLKGALPPFFPTSEAAAIAANGRLLRAVVIIVASTCITYSFSATDRIVVLSTGRLTVCIVACTTFFRTDETTIVATDGLTVGALAVSSACFAEALDSTSTITTSCMWRLRQPT